MEEIIRNMIINHWDTTFYHNFKRSMETADQVSQSLEEESDDPKIQVLFEGFNPDYLDYRTGFLYWKSETNLYRGSSSLIKDSFAQLSGDEIDIVDKFLKNIYISDKQKYITLMPNGKKPFQKGTYTERVLASEQLTTAMLLRTELLPITSRFKLFSDNLGKDRKTQRGHKQSVRSASTELEKKRVILAGKLFWVYGGLVQIYFLVPKEIAKFYELNQMFAKKPGEIAANPDVTVVSLEPLETKEAGMNFVPGDIISASDIGNSDVEFWITDGTPPNANTKKGIIHSGEEFLIKPPEWATSDCRYLYFKCLDNEFNGIIHLVKVNPATT